MSTSKNVNRFEVERVRNDFPILKTQVHGNTLAYLDNAATAQKPKIVLDALERYYSEENANVHRGVHTLSERATRSYEGARQRVCQYLNAADPREIVFTRGTTESINLIAQSWGVANLSSGDEVILSQMEHHSNIVPWQLLRERLGISLRVAPIDVRGELVFSEFEKCFSNRTKLVALTHVSNALGTINPVHEITQLAHDRGVPVLLDGAQALPHLCVDVREIDCDFYTFSSHKVFGPTGIGALYAKEQILETMPPWQGGGR